MPGPRKNADEMIVKSAELIGWALGGIEREIVETKSRLAALTAQANALRKKVGNRAEAAVAAAAPAVRRRRKMSADARKRISERMSKLWAERRKAKRK